MCASPDADTLKNKRGQVNPRAACGSPGNVAVQSSGETQATSPAPQPLTASFELNVGQSDPRVEFLSRGLSIEKDSMGKVAGNTVRGKITNVLVGENDSIVTVDQTLELERFEGGKLTDRMGRTFDVVDNPVASQLLVHNLPNGITPAQGKFELVDDDQFKDGVDVPDVPNDVLRELGDALAEAYVQIVISAVNSPSNESSKVPFLLNIGNAAEKLINDNWDTMPLNENSFWVTYLITAFQAETNLDGDPDSEKMTLGETIVATGGSIIYLEALKDYESQGRGAFGTKLADTVVHEVGHALSSHQEHPVTGLDAKEKEVAQGTRSQDGVLVTHHNPSRYLPAYLDWIRWAAKPRMSATPRPNPGKP